MDLTILRKLKTVTFWFDSRSHKKLTDFNFKVRLFSQVSQNMSFKASLNSPYLNKPR